MKERTTNLITRRVGTQMFREATGLSWATSKATVGAIETVKDGKRLKVRQRDLRAAITEANAPKTMEFTCRPLSAKHRAIAARI